MVLNVVWYVLFVVIIAGYLILDGFDLGVGILHPFVAKTDEERRINLNSIGPIWDGNEVWLVLGGGALFAAFPVVYASLFSGFYAAMMLVLLFLILRTVAIEFRSKRQGRWRSFWDIIFFVSSLSIALLLGVAFGNIMSGVPINAEGTITASLFNLLTPFALLVGVTTVLMLAAHGAIYLSLKTEGDLQARVRRLAPILLFAFFVLNTVIVLMTVLFRREIFDSYLARLWPVIFPALALVLVITAYFMLRRGKDLLAFLASGAMIAMLLFSAAAGLYPNLMISTTDPAFNLTIFNSASAPNTLQVMLVIALIGMPFVLLYTAGVYYFFRGKVRLDPTSY